MTRYVLAILALFPLSVLARQDIDQQLAGYVKKFQLQPLEKPVSKNPKLFDLGHSLFEDKVLSGNNNISCRDCHHPRSMTVDGLPLGLGEGSEGIQAAGQIRSQKNGHVLPRNTQALFNLDQIDVMFWDGRVSFDPKTKEVTTPTPLRAEVKNTLKSALAAQALFPMVDHEEMRGQRGSNAIADAKTDAEAWDLIVAKVMSRPEYRKAFQEIYPNEKINIGHIGEAIAEFQRVNFFFADTAYDRYLKGDLKAMNEIQKLGMDVFFNKGKCGECHNGAHLSNFEFHNVGAQQIGPGKNKGDDLGRHEVDKSQQPYSFRVPPLRNVAVTAPYMHAGTIKTLPQVVEHYDMIVESLTGFKLINNWKNYVSSLEDHDHRNDDLRVASLSEKLTPLLKFTEEEEKALSEFLATALTDKTLLNREIDGDYKSHFRLQLRPSGYQKINAAYPAPKEKTVWYYFDALLEGGFALRELAQPIRLIVIKDQTSTQLVYREQAFKSAVAENNVVLGVTFDRQELKTLSSSAFNPIEEAYLDMFNRLYTYNDGTRRDEIPATELSVIKSDLEIMAENFRKIDFKGADTISDKMNFAKDEVMYVPTSYNTKLLSRFSIVVDGKTISAELQDSTLRTETGAIEKTYALEMETSKLSKAQVEAIGKKILGTLNLTASDVGGGSPSPSNLTLEVINQVIE